MERVAYSHATRFGAVLISVVRDRITMVSFKDAQARCSEWSRVGGACLKQVISVRYLATSENNSPDTRNVLGGFYIS